MVEHKPTPGVSRDTCDTEESLQRLEKQLAAGNISQTVLAQWIRRHGDAARTLIKQYGQYGDDLE